MSADQPPGLTILGRCGLGLRLVVENTRSFEWISLPPKGAPQGEGAAARGSVVAAKAERGEAD